MKRIFSGVKPSGEIHIGNYIGALRNWVKLQADYESIFCVVDLHAITVPQNPEILRKRIIDIAKIYLACGISVQNKSASDKNSAFPIIFIQSHVPEHSELAWILNTIAKVSEMERMTQFKDKSRKGGRENASVGLFDYPVLMAADILLYDTNLVPVGEDQLQHVELTRTLARRFNRKFGDTFVVPEAYVSKEGMRIMGLIHPEGKMGKSSESEYNQIKLLDPPEVIRKKIMKAVTDSGTEIKYEDSKPALKNLMNIYCAFSGKTPAEIEKEYAGKGYADFKKGLAEAVITGLKPIQEDYQKLSNEKVLEILKIGAERAKSLAQKKMQEVKKKIGLLNML